MSSPIITCDSSSSCGSSSTCKAISAKNTLATQNVWVHIGTGTHKKDDLVTKSKKVTVSNGTVIDVSSLNPVDNFFTKRDIEQESSAKPFACIWFSHGSWVFDPYTETRCSGDNECNKHKLSDAHCVLIKNPKNILTISTLEEVGKFFDMYGSTKPTNEAYSIEKARNDLKNDSFLMAHNSPNVRTKLESFEKYQRAFKDVTTFFEQNPEYLLKFIGDTINSLKKLYPNVKPYCDANDFYTLRTVCELVKLDFLEKMELTTCKDHDKIDWYRVKDAGYYGVAFEFRSVKKLEGFPTDNLYKEMQKYNWHSGFDVETLCVWDHRAFDNTVYPVILSTD
jgi:hypothetical protein